LAPRDIVARAIVAEMAKSGEAHVLLDFRDLPTRVIQERFPNIAARCLEHGIDLRRDLVPVSPAAHYFMGGIAVDVDGRSTLPGLYACGECACTGVHGANRLASNSMLEGLVFGDRCARSMDTESADVHGVAGSAQAEDERLREELPVAGDEEAESTSPSVADLRAALRRLMSEGVGIMRSGDSLARAAEELQRLQEAAREHRWGAPERLELTNMLTVAGLIVAAATARRESRGAHYRTDYPQPDDAWRKHIRFCRGRNGRRQMRFQEA
jgi:L-aspartate oxidase